LSPECVAHRDLHSFPTRRSSDLVLSGTGESQLTGDVPDIAVLNILGARMVLTVTADTGAIHFFDFFDGIQIESSLIIDDAIGVRDRKSTRLNSSHVKISYAVFCL